jgi:alcohol dehydrogenase class IV
MILPFTFASIPHIVFGAGSIAKVGELSARFGDSVLLITGGGSLKRAGKLDEITAALHAGGVGYAVLSVVGEPSPELVDSAVAEFKNKRIDAVVAVGGGSVMDFGKAVSAMLVVGKTDGLSVTEFLEGVGTRTHDGTKVPLIAVPTTSGTGSEATKNAVLSRIGADGFKKSIRHDNFVPNVAIIDPELTLSCPAEVTAACGMDALTQLLESYFSTKANPMTDVLALSGIRAVGKSLIAASTKSPRSLAARTSMAYAAVISGITLANAGLGLVHGIASVIGGSFDIPHGAACANIMGPAMEKTLEVLKEGVPGADEERSKALWRFAQAGALLAGKDSVRESDTDEYSRLLIETIYRWTELLDIPRLGTYGMKGRDIERLASLSENKNNPVPISREGIEQILRERL